MSPSDFLWITRKLFCIDESFLGPADNLLWWYFHQDFEAIDIDKRGFKLRLEKAAKKLPSLPIETAIPVSYYLIEIPTWDL